MKAPRFKGWFAKLPSLNQPQRRQVLDALHPAAGLDQVVALISEARAPGRCCPRCGNERCYRHGVANDLQRYRCCACGRTFNDLTGTPLARLRLKAKWLAYSQVLLDSLPVRKAADRVGVHRSTAFRWRHRFLHWAKLDRPGSLNGRLGGGGGHGVADGESDTVHLSSTKPQALNCAAAGSAGG